MTGDPQHGDERARRLESRIEYDEFTSTVTGETFRLATGGVTQTVSERYCEKCGTWREARGIMGALFCPVCTTPWNKKFWEK